MRERQPDLSPRYQGFHIISYGELLSGATREVARIVYCDAIGIQHLDSWIWNRAVAWFDLKNFRSYHEYCHGEYSKRHPDTPPPPWHVPVLQERVARLIQAEGEILLALMPEAIREHWEWELKTHPHGALVEHDIGFQTLTIDAPPELIWLNPLHGSLGDEPPGWKD